jgi:hypothetical protein
MPRAALAAFILAAVVVPMATASGLDRPQVRINAPDQAAAKFALVRKADLGSGWTGGPKKPDLSSTMSCPGYTPKQSDLVVTGAAETDFQRPGVAVQSIAQVMKTSSMVARDWQRTVLDPRAFKCLRYTLAKQLTKQERIVSFSKLGFPHLARFTNAYRIEIEVRAQAQKVRLTSDLIVIGRGRTELTLSVTAPTVAEKNLVKAELELARAMVARVRA